MREEFLKQTAKDYDMDLFDVKNISNKNELDYEGFYNDLELFIKNRGNE